MVAASERPVRTARRGTTTRDFADTVFANPVDVVFASASGDTTSEDNFGSRAVAPINDRAILPMDRHKDFADTGGGCNQRTNTGGAVSGKNDRPALRRSVFQDLCGFWVIGPRSDIYVGRGDLERADGNTPNNINFIVNSADDDFNSEMDGDPGVAGDTITLTIGQMVTLKADEDDLTFACELFFDENTDTWHFNAISIPCLVAGPPVISPQHRTLTRDIAGEIRCGDADVLIAAKDPANGASVRRRAGATQTDPHRPFDRHQIVLSESLAPQIGTVFDPRTLAEIIAISADRNPVTRQGDRQTVRRTLKRDRAEIPRNFRRAA